MSSTSSRPADHPYHWLTIGAAEDIAAARIEDAREFFSTYYRPSNASLSIAGDVRPDEALRLAEAYFGDLDAGDPVPPVVAPLPGPRYEETRLVLEDRVELPRIYMAWHSPALFAPGDAELDLVAEVCARHRPPALMLERDGNYPPASTLRAELDAIAAASGYPAVTS